MLPKATHHHQTRNSEDLAIHTKLEQIFSNTLSSPTQFWNGTNLALVPKIQLTQCIEITY